MSVRLPALKGNALCRFAQRGPCPSGRCERAAKGYGGGRPGAPCEEYGVFRVKETREALRRNLGGTTGVFLALVPIGTGAFLFFQSPRFDPTAFPEQIIHHQ